MDELINLPKIKTPLAKRIFDIFGSVFALILFSPVILLIIISMMIEQVFFPSARGPIFYYETRISFGEEFKIIKFRIFKISALKTAPQEEGCLHTKELEKNKINLTYLGRFLRRTYLDELPQFFNILKGR